MPAGDLLNGNNQVEIRDTLTGFGTSWLLAFEGVGGLGVPQPKTGDTDLGHAAGAYFGRDYAGVRILTVPYVIRAPKATVGSLFRTLCGLWAPSETNLPLHLQLPGGIGHISVNGRPRGLAEDMSNLNVGLVRALATFVCGDPTILTPPSAPTIGTATAGAGTATFNWTPPADWGGNVGSQEVWLYQVSTGFHIATSNILGPSITTYTFTGRTAGVAVFGKVFGVNSVGRSPASANSNTVTPT